MVSCPITGCFNVNRYCPVRSVWFPCVVRVFWVVLSEDLFISYLTIFHVLIKAVYQFLIIAYLFTLHIMSEAASSLIKRCPNVLVESTCIFSLLLDVLFCFTGCVHGLAEDFLCFIRRMLSCLTTGCFHVLSEDVFMSSQRFFYVPLEDVFHVSLQNVFLSCKRMLFSCPVKGCPHVLSEDVSMSPQRMALYPVREYFHPIR